jgi:uncharacterized sporulation protein YeaH/YhbH (DUF444 family)
MQLLVSIELKKISEKTADLKLKINDLHNEISRLTNTDFDKLFKDLQKKNKPEPFIPTELASEILKEK